MKTVEVYS